MYQHWDSCTRLGTYSKVTIPDYHNLEEFSVTKAYVDWWIRVHNPDKKIFTVACMEPPPDSSWKIPSKYLESRTRKVDSSVSTKGNVRDNIKKDFDDLPDDSKLLLSAQLVEVKLIPSHTQSMRTLFSIVVVLIVIRLLSNITMHKVFLYQTTTLKIQVNVTSNAERLDPTLCTMMRLTLILLMQMSSLLTSQLLLNR